MGFGSSLVLMSVVTLAYAGGSCGQVPELELMRLAGVLTCTNASIASVKTYPVIPEAQVDVVCGISFLEKVIKSTITNPRGIYSFSFNVSDVVVLSIPDLCYLKVKVPPTSCLFDPPGGILKFHIIATQSGLGLLNGFTTGAPTYMSVL